MVGGPNEAVKRLAPILDVLAPPPTEEHGPGWGHLGPTGAGHYVKMVHNGIEYGLMQAYAEGFELFDASRVRARQRARSPTSGCRARSCARGCASWPRRPSSRRATTSPTLDAATSRTPARAAGRSRTRSTSDVPTPVHHRLAVRALLLARQRRLHRPRSTRRCARSSAATRSQKAGDDELEPSGTRWSRASSGSRSTPRRWSIFGATGDLAKRKLLPALYNLAHEGALPERFDLIGVVAQRHDRTRSSARSPSEAIREFSRREPDETVLERAARATSATCPARSTTRRSTSSSARRSTSSTRTPASRSTAPSTSRRRRSSSR